MTGTTNEVETVSALIVEDHPMVREGLAGVWRGTR
jgi:hypothetical protein